MKKLTANEIDKLNNLKNDYKEARHNVITALMQFYAMAKIVKETGETYRCPELQEIGKSTMVGATTASEYFQCAELKDEWERVRELVRFTWGEE